MKLAIKYGLPFVEAVLTHKNKKVLLPNILVDTGSASTIISADTAVELDLEPEPSDKIRRIQGVGGTEFVYEKNIDGIELDSKIVPNFKIQVGAMDYGFEIKAILGMDFLMLTKMVLDTGKKIMYFT